MRSLFVRVFLTFCLASTVTLAILMTITAITNARPLSHQWLTHTLDLYAATAVDGYENGGPARLRQFLFAIEEDSKIKATLLRENENVGSAPIPEKAKALLAKARETQRSAYGFRDPWLGVVRHVRDGKTYYFVAETEPVRIFGPFLDPERRLVRLSAVLLISAIFCGLLARNITRPIRSLQQTAMAIAEGDLSARATPALAGRNDELAMLARDFDRMADKIQFLIDRQKLLLRDISHELRSPLARLSVSAELVQRGDMSGAGRMLADIRSLERMISDLLTLAKIEASESLSRREPVHIGRLVQRIVQDASFEGSPEQKTVVQTGIFDRYVLAETGLLHSCIENVVRNALKHTPREGVVEVNLAEADAKFLSIRVKDEGPGVPEYALEQIFDPFFRVATQESHREGGGGLGLSISKRVTNLYGGSIRARNREEGGLEVEIQLPLAKA